MCLQSAPSDGFAPRFRLTLPIVGSASSVSKTRFLITLVFELLKDPVRRDWLAADWGRAGLAVEEFLRFVSLVQFSKPRYVRRDVDLEGVKLKKGDRVMAMLVAANLDSAANACPERLDLERRPNRHLSFGTGIHFCLGHQLARIEGICALQALFTRWPELKLAVEPSQIHWRRRPGIRMIAELPVMAGV
jgi:cytochrome P450